MSKCYPSAPDHLKTCMYPHITALLAAGSTLGHNPVFAQTVGTDFSSVVLGLSGVHWGLIAFALAMAIGLVLQRMRRRRALKEAKFYDLQPTMFAHTMVVDSNLNQRTLPQPLAPHPHADQVWTTQ